MTAKRSTIKTRNINKGVEGTNIDKAKYKAVRKAILAVVPKTGDGIRFKDLPREIVKRVPTEHFPKRGSASWYTTVVKLDLEARKLIERVPGSSPQRLRRLK